MRSASCASRDSLARWRSSMRKASDVGSTPRRLRATSASLRIWMVATSATSSARSHTLTPRARGTRRAVLGRADIWYSQARVVRGHRDVGSALEREMELELHLAGADIGQRRRVVQRFLHPVAVPD